MREKQCLIVGYLVEERSLLSRTYGVRKGRQSKVLKEENASC